MKSRLSKLLILTLVFTMLTPLFALAETQSSGEYLKDLGVIQGDGTSLMEDAQWNRQDLAVILSRLLGQEDEAKATAKSHTYADVTDSFYDGYLSWAKENGYMEGYSATKFGFGDKVTQQQFAAVMLRALGYDTTGANYALVPGYAANLGLVAAGTDFNEAAKRGAYYDVIVKTLGTEVKGGDQTLGTKLGLAGYVKEAAPAVESVKAVNFSEIEVAYNKVIDEDSLDVTNFLVGGTALSAAADSIELLEDGKTVRIFKSSGFVASQQSKIKVSLSGVESVNGVEMPEVKNQELTFTDLEFPKVVSAKATGNKLVTLTFSEPVQNLVDAKVYANYKIDGNPVVGTNLPVVNGRTIELTLASALTTGEHKIVVETGKVKDYAGFGIGANETVFTVNEDNEAPTATVLSAYQNEVVVQYSEQVKGASTASNVYWIDGSVYKTAASVTQDKTDKTKYTYTFSDGNALPLTSTKLYLKNIEDYSGNKNANPLEIAVLAKADVERPTVVSVEAKSESDLRIKFSEKVRNNTVGTSIVIKNADGDVVTTLTQPFAYYVDTTVTPNVTHYDVIKVTNVLDPADGPFTIEVKDFVDQSVQQNKSLQQFFTFEVPDKTSVIVPPTYSYNTTSNTIAIAFNEKVDPAVALNRSNYAYLEQSESGPVYGYQPLPADATLTLAADGKTVIITFPSTWKVNLNNRTFAGQMAQAGSNLQVSNITDLAGNKIYTAFVSSGSPSTAPTLGSAVAISKNEIYVPVTNGLPINLYAGDFQVYADADNSGDVNAGDVLLTVTAANFHDYDGNGVNDGIKLTLGQNMDATGKYDVSGTPQNVMVTTVVSPVYTKNAFGDAITGSDLDGLADKVKPSYASKTVSGATITLTFDEAINFNVVANAGELANVMVVKDSKGNRLVPQADYTTSISGSTLVVTVIKPGFNGTLSEISLDGLYLKDAANNKANSFTTNTGVELVKEATAPAQVTGFAATDAIGSSNINLSWSANSETDFSHYLVYLGANDTGILVSNTNTLAAVYNATGQGTNTLTFAIYAVDTLGNKSAVQTTTVVVDETN